MVQLKSVLDPKDYKNNKTSIEKTTDRSLHVTGS